MLKRLARASVVLAVGSALLPLVVPAQPAGAVVNPVIVVTTTVDTLNPSDGVLSLREAVDLANATAGADTIQLASDAAYPLSICDGSPIDENADANGDLDATDVAGLTVLTSSPNTAHAAEIVQTCSSLSQERVIQSIGGPLTLSFVRIRGGYASGGAAVSSTGALTLDSAYVSGSHGDGTSFAAAVSVVGASLAVTNSDISGNVAAMGVDVSGSNLAATASISNSTISNNSLPHGASGGLLDGRGGTFPASTPLVVTNSTITGNSTGLDLPPAVAGGILAGHSGATITGSTISDNAGFWGGGVRSGGLLTITGSTLRWNRAVVGGGISGDNVALDGVTVVANTATLLGGGVVAGGTITRSTISGNSSPFGGGIGIDAADNPALSLTVTDSTLAGNVAHAAGAIGSGNSISPPAKPVAPVTLLHDTLVDNMATLAGGGNDLGVGNGLVPAGSFTMGATALGSVGVGGPDCDLPPGAVTSLGSNASVDASCGLTQGGSDHPAVGDLGLVPGATIPGPPGENLAAAYSPVIGSAVKDVIPSADPLCAGSDQLGDARPAIPGSNCDIGSVEAQAGYYPPGHDAFVGLPPTRVLDTRVGVGNVPMLRGGQPQQTTIGGVGGVPATASAVVLNVTATNASASTFVTVFPGGVAVPPVASNLNVRPGQTVPNLVTVKLGKGGTVAFLAGAGSLDLVGDVVGYYTAPYDPGSKLATVSPTRVIDTRPGTGHLGFTTIGPAQTKSLVIPSAPAGATSVVLNVTVTNPTTAGFLTTFPTAAAPNSPPLASSLNFTPGQTVANLVTAKLGAGGSVSFYNSSGSTDVVVDVVGWFTTGSTVLFTPVSPVRLADAREPTSPIATLAPRTHEDLLVADGVRVPADAKAVLVNVTAVNPTGAGYLTVYPTAGPPNPPPLASNLNFLAGQIVPNLVVATLSADGRLSFFNGSAGPVDLVVDLVGWYR
jgi:CSLREA domain-containing protein